MSINSPLNVSINLDDSIQRGMSSARIRSKAANMWKIDFSRISSKDSAANEDSDDSE